MSEGTCRIDDGRQQKVLKHSPMSIVSAVTPDMYIAHYKKWKALGFIRRFIIINYSYNLETRREGNTKIRQGKITSSPLPEVIIDASENGKKFNVEIPKDRAKDIEIISLELAKNLGYNLVRDSRTHKVIWMIKEPALEFAPHLTLQAIAKGNALKHKRYKVGAEDIDFLTKLMDFTDPSSPGRI
jgi:hypothetical protein